LVETDAVQITLVPPTEISADPSALETKPGSIVTGRMSASDLSKLLLLVGMCRSLPEATGRRDQVSKARRAADGPRPPRRAGDPGGYPAAAT
jgi:hypothetical protein